MAPSKRPAPPLWSVNAAGTHAASVRPDGVIDLFSLSTATRQKAPKLPALHSRPASLSLQFLPARVAVGTEVGDVFVGDRCVVSLEGASAIVAAADDTVVVGGGADRELVCVRGGEVRGRFALGAEHRAPISALAVTRDGLRAVVCSQAVTLVDVGSGGVVKRYTGHASKVTAVGFVGGGKRFVTGCEGDRFVCVWDAEGKEGKKSKRRRKNGVAAPLGTLVAPEDGVVSLCIDGSETGRGAVAAVLKSGGVAVWKECSEKGGGVPASFVIKGDVLVAGFMKRGVLNVLYGAGLKPSLWKIVLDEVEGESVVLPEAEKGLLLERKKGKEKEKEREKEGLVKGVELLGGSAVPALQGGKERRKMNGILKLAQDSDAEEEASDEEEEESDGDAEPSIQEKLVAMGVRQDGADLPGVKGFPVPSRDSTVLGSRVNVLLQAVRSGDADLFDQSIERVRGKALIQSTVERIPAEVAAGAFLDMLVDRLQKFPTRAELLVPWIREVMMEHVGALISQQRNRALVALVALVTERMQALDGLAKLEGRLELVVGQTERLKRAGRRTKMANAKPVAEYEEEEAEVGEESEDDDEESEDDDEESSSEESDESEEGSDEGEDETGDFNNSDKSSVDDSDSDEEMAVASGENEKVGSDDAEDTTRMNGNRADSSEGGTSDESSDDGD